MKDNGIDSKILEMACKDYLLAAVTNSKSLRKKLTFGEQVKLAEHVMSMGYNDVVSVLFYDGEKITTEQIRDFEGKTKKGLKYGAAATVAGAAGKVAHYKLAGRAGEKHPNIGTAASNASKATKKAVEKAQAKAGKLTLAGKSGNVVKKVLGAPLKAGKLRVAGPAGRAAAIGVGLLYLYRKISDPCVRKSLSIKNIGQRKLSKHQCQAEACKKVINSISSDMSRCNKAANPEKCRKKLEGEVMKWKQKYQKEIIEISKIKSKMGKNG